MVEWYDERRVLLVEMSFMRHMSSILIIIILRSTSGYYYIFIYSGWYVEARRGF